MTHSWHAESHFTGRIGWLRASVLGANDGIVSTASLVVGVAAPEAARGQVLLAGVAGLVAGAMSMAAGGAEVVRGAGHVVLWGAVAMGLMALVGHAVGTVL